MDEFFKVRIEDHDLDDDRNALALSEDGEVKEVWYRKARVAHYYWDISKDAESKSDPTLGNEAWIRATAKECALAEDVVCGTDVEDVMHQLNAFDRNHSYINSYKSERSSKYIFDEAEGVWKENNRINDVDDAKEIVKLDAPRLRSWAMDDIQVHELASIIKDSGPIACDDWREFPKLHHLVDDDDIGEEARNNSDFKFVPLSDGTNFLVFNRQEGQIELNEKAYKKSRANVKSAITRRNRTEKNKEENGRLSCFCLWVNNFNDELQELREGVFLECSMLRQAVPSFRHSREGIISVVNRIYDFYKQDYPYIHPRGRRHIDKVMKKNLMLFFLSYKDILTDKWVEQDEMKQWQTKNPAWNEQVIWHTKYKLNYSYGYGDFSKKIAFFGRQIRKHMKNNFNEGIIIDMITSKYADGIKGKATTFREWSTDVASTKNES